MQRVLGLLVMALAVVSWVEPASAALTLRLATSDAALSIDGTGITGASGQISSDTPNGAIVEKAFLYVSSTGFSGTGSLTNVSLAGTTFQNSDAISSFATSIQSRTNVYDVTTLMKAQIEGTWGLQNHAYTETSSSSIDGAALVVVYKHASTVGGTAIILDGALSTTGDSTLLNFSSPYAGGTAIMSLASSFSHQPTGQVTIIDITTTNTNDRRLSSCAGGEDDGSASNGALFTVGGIGDSAGNPAPACSGGNGPLVDDELYDLSQGNSADASPFLQTGDQFIRFDTLNPSNDDNVHFIGITSTFRVTQVDDQTVDDTGGSTEDTGGVPAPASLIILGLGLMAAGAARRWFR